MDREHRVRRGLVHPRTLARDRLEEPGRVGHDVADHLRLPFDSLVRERLAGTLVGAEEELCDPVGLDPVALLGHRQVAAAEPRLDVREPDPELRRGLGAGEGRVRVAVDERPVGLLLDQTVLDRRAHEIRVCGAQVEPVARLVEPELLEEDLRQLAVVVLSRVDHDLLETAFA